MSDAPPSMIPPFFVIHYTGYAERRRYLEVQFSRCALPLPEYIIEFESQEFLLNDVYTYDEAQYKKCIEPIRDILISYVIGLFELPNARWIDCFDVYKKRNLSLDEEFSLYPWMRPHPLTKAGVSIFLQHRAAWEKIANGKSEYAVIAEDDIIFAQGSGEYLRALIAHLPNDFDYIDLAGGCGLLPRADNRVVNEVFYEILPPRDRTCCCALLSRSFARRLLALNLPICLPIDWSLTVAFKAIQAKVYWLHPPVFAHGSEMNIYKSNVH